MCSTLRHVENCNVPFLFCFAESIRTGFVGGYSARIVAPVCMVRGAVCGHGVWVRVGVKCVCVCVCRCWCVCERETERETEKNRERRETETEAETERHRERISWKPSTGPQVYSVFSLPFSPHLTITVP